MTTKPRLLVLLPPSLYGELFTAEANAALQQAAAITCNSEERNWSSVELAARVAGYDAVITGWGSPKLTDEILNAARDLLLIAHSAGSIKQMLPPAVFGRGIHVTHAAAAIAPAVAEMTLLLILLCLRQVHRLDRNLKAGEPWDAAKRAGMGQELAGQRVGVIGAGHTGRMVIGLLAACKVQVWVYDPYLSAARADQLGVQRVANLDELFAACPIVTVHAPPTQETHHMLGAQQLSRLQDGAIFVNTARSQVVDSDALLAELRSGRIQAALDVFDQEPLPVDSPFRQLDNVVITPHVAGASRQARIRQGQTIADEIQRFFAGQPLLYEVTEEMLDTMA